MTFLTFITAACLGLSIVFGAHIFVYVSIVHFFGISPAGRHLLAVFLAFLSVSFFIASLCAHFWETVLTRTFYFLSAFWLGLLVNLFLASIVVWILLSAGHLFGLSFDGAIVAGIVFVATFAISIYGVWNAFHPMVKEVTIHIPNLPSIWRGKRIVQLSDVHLGNIYRADFLSGVVEQVNKLHPEMVLITGDLFDGMDGSLGTLAAPLGDIRSGKGTFFVTGNHETYLGTEKAFAALKETKVRILQDEVVDIDGLRIIGIGYPERNVNKDIPAVLTSLRPSFAGTPNILLFHSPTSIAEFKNAGVTLQLSGHTHLGQQFPFQYVTRILYGGHDYGLFVDGEYSLYTTNGVGTWGPPMRIGNTPEIVSITLE